MHVATRKLAALSCSDRHKPKNGSPYFYRYGLRTVTDQLLSSRQEYIFGSLVSCFVGFMVQIGPVTRTIGASQASA